MRFSKHPKSLGIGTIYPPAPLVRGAHPLPRPQILFTTSVRIHAVSTKGPKDRRVRRVHGLRSNTSTPPARRPAALWAARVDAVFADRDVCLAEEARVVRCKAWRPHLTAQLHALPRVPLLCRRRDLRFCGAPTRFARSQAGSRGDGRFGGHADYGANLGPRPACVWRASREYTSPMVLRLDSQAMGSRFRTTGHKLQINDD